MINLGALLPKTEWGNIPLGTVIADPRMTAFVSESNDIVQPKEVISKDQSDRLYKVFKLHTTKVDPVQFFMGLNVELEHINVTGGNLKKTALLVLAHLKEDPKYYTKLQDMESDSVSETSIPLLSSLLETGPAKGKKWKTNGVSHGQAGVTISPGSKRGDAYCARSAGIKGDWKSDPNSPNNLSRKKWKCRGKKSMK